MGQIKFADIRPNPEFGRQFGNQTISAIFYDDEDMNKAKDKRRVVLDASGGNMISIAPEGMMLQLDGTQPRHTEIFEAIQKNAQLRALIGSEDNLGKGQRFYLHIQDNIDAKQIVVNDDKHKLRSEIYGLSGKRILAFGKIFGLIGTETNVKNRLIDMVDTDPIKTAEILKYLNHPDRTVIEVIHGALAFGDPNEKSGLYMSGGHYYFNGSVLSADIDEVVSFMKAKENHEAYLFLKSKVFDEEVESAKKGKSKKD